jgi:inositol-phosphate phosphatase / L-galactose 1-phosphate phosphatase / histidinol-phosphatase
MTTTATEEVSRRYDALATLLDIARDVLRSAFRSGGITTHTKPSISPLVTDTDREVEIAIRGAIRARFPDDAFLGEEEAPLDGSSSFQWVVDPIDGTSSFVRGLPLFGTLIGCIDRTSHQILFGGADQSIVEDRVVACRGVTPLWNNAPIVNHLANPSSYTIGDACLCASTPAMFSTPEERAGYERVRSVCQRTAWGGDWFNYVMMISGKTAIPLVVVEAGLSFYDICALVPIIEGAGGAISDWAGKPVTCETTQVIAAPSPYLWKDLLAAIKG